MRLKLFLSSMIVLILSVECFGRCELFNPIEPTLYQSDGRSQILENRGRWSIGEGEEWIDLAGTWTINKANSVEPDTVTVPFAWKDGSTEIQISRSFILPDRLQGHHWRLVLDGCGQHCSIMLNGTNLDSRNGDEVSIQFDLNPRLLKFKNSINTMTLRLKRDVDPVSANAVQRKIFAKLRYGGVTRGVYLVASPVVRIADINADWVVDSSGLSGFFEVETEIRRGPREAISDKIAESDCKFSMFLYDPDSVPIAALTNREISFNQLGVAKYFFRIRIPEPILWDLNKIPGLYKIQAVIDNGRQEHSFSSLHGIRSISLLDSGFIINGTLRKIRCVSHINADPINAVIIDKTDIEENVSMIKEMGINAVRIEQGAANPIFLDFCDKAGLLVFEELPVYQMPDPLLSERDFIQSAMNQLESMIIRDRRFTCIAGWGIGSELNPPNDHNREYYQKLCQLAHQLDDRPVYASFPFTDEYRASPLDFAILELTPYSSWREEPLPVEIQGDIPNLVGCIRQVVKPGSMGGWADPTSESGQTHYIIERVREIESKGWCSGVIVGDFEDWEGVIPSISGPQKGQSNLYTTGLTSPDGRPRPVYHRLKEYWAASTVDPLDRGAEARHDGIMMLVVGFGLIFILVIATRRNNLFRFNIQRTFSSPRGFFHEISERRYFQMGHTLFIAVLISGGVALVVNGWLQANRGDYALDWIVGFLIGCSVPVKWFATLIWSPERGLLFFWAATFLLIWVIAVQSHIITRALGLKTTLSQNLDFMIWSSACMLGLLPIGLISERLFRTTGSWVGIAAFLALFIWSFLRMISVYQNHTRRSVTVVVGLWTLPPLVIMILLVIVLQYSKDFIHYWNFFWNTIVSN